MADGAAAGEGTPAGGAAPGEAADAKRASGGAGARGLADAHARRRIREKLDRNMVVEAAAGAGKTHELVGRVVALVAAGRCTVDRVAAVTFTRKAAGELRGRLLARLEEARDGLRPDGPGAERRRLDRALSTFEEGFAGTIHSFCARLLRERPVEAGVDPGFSEMDEREEEMLRREAWDDWLDRGGARAGRRLEAVEELGVSPEELFPTYRRLCDYPEVEVPRERRPAPDLREAAGRAERFVRRALPHVPDEPVEGRYGDLQSTLFAARSFLRNRALETEAERARFLELFTRGATPTLKLWGDDDVARGVRDALERLRERWIDGGLRAWREHAHPVLLDFVEPAVRHYRRTRHRRGRLNFQDLLLRTAETLRAHPEVRRHFAERYPRLLVDEFQDTDPLQAEILFLLTGGDEREAGWRRLRPRPGSLFLVGDPKQSIYRFRRADIDVYRFVRERIREGGGEVVTLSTSFRSTRPLVEWLNGGLEPVFARRRRDVQPPFAALDPHREAGEDPHGVRRLEHEKVPYNRAAEVAAEDARRIARWIRRAVDAPSAPEGMPGGPVSPGDALVLLRQKKHLSVYARALEREGLAYEVSGGGALSDSDELSALLRLARAALRPDDPVALVAYLRGPLAGISDDALHRFRDAGGEWRYPAYAGDGARKVPSSREAGALSEAFSALAGARRDLQGLPPAAALEKLLDDTGLLADAAGREAGSSRAGALLKALSLVRGWQADGREVAWILEELEALSAGDGPEVDEMVLETGRSDVVRVMNVHKAKGLQGRVVFLADPLKAPRTRVECHVERLGEDEPRGHFPVFAENPRGGTGRPLGLPAGWEEMEAREERYLRAEEDRLLYVAATRARDLLVVSRYPHPDRGPWTELYAALEDVPSLGEPPPAGRGGARERSVAGPSGTPDEGEPAAAASGTREGRPTAPGGAGDAPPDRQALAARWEAVRAPGYRIRRATDDVAAPPARSGGRGAGAEGGRPVAAGAAAGSSGAAGGGRGPDAAGREPAEARAFGSAVHAYLRRLVEGRVSDPRSLAGSLLEEADADRGLVPEVLAAARSLRESALWEEIRTADRRLCEVPLAVRGEDLAPSAREPGGGEDEPGTPELVRGVVDLAVGSGGAWTLVDHKTDRVAGEEVAAAAVRYGGQLDVYRRAWEAAVGEPVRTAGLFFTHPGRWWETEA